MESGGRPYVAHGCGSRVGDVARSSEKDHATGRHVRVWHVTREGLGSRGEHVAAC